MTEPSAPMPPLCAGCGYDVRLLDPAGACPECGRPLRDARPAGDLLGFRRRRWLAWACGLYVAATLVTCVVWLAASFARPRLFDANARMDPAMSFLLSASIWLSGAQVLMVASAYALFARVATTARAMRVLAALLWIASLCAAHGVLKDVSLLTHLPVRLPWPAGSWLEAYASDAAPLALTVFIIVVAARLERPALQSAACVVAVVLAFELLPGPAIWPALGLSGNRWIAGLLTPALALWLARSIRAPAA